MRKREGGMWRDVVALTLAALLLGAAIMIIANVGDGPMREHRGSWVTQHRNSAVEAVAQFGLAEKSFEISQPGARQLFSIVLSRLLPLLEISFDQAAPFNRGPRPPAVGPT